MYFALNNVQRSTVLPLVASNCCCSVNSVYRSYVCTQVVDDGRSDWWLVRTRPTTAVASTEGWVPSAALTPLMKEEVEPPQEVSCHDS